MACGQSNYTPPGAISISGPHPPGAVEWSDDRCLIVSNAPETLTTAYLDEALTDGSRTLYKCEIPLVAEQSKQFRCFLWHANETGQSLELKLLASLSTGTGTMSARRHESKQNTTNNPTVGICLAKSQLYETLDEVEDSLSLSPTEVSVLTNVWNPASTSSGRLCASVVEFSVETDQNCSLRFRSVAAHGGSSGSWSDNPVDPDLGEVPVHVRGWWPRSSIRLPFQGQVDTNTVVASIIRAGVNEAIIPNDPPVFPQELQSSGFGHQGATIDPHGTDKGNNGLYGANVHYRFESINSDEENDHAAYCRLVLRNNVKQDNPNLPPLATFFGAAYIVEPSGYSELGVPPLEGYGTVPPGYTFDYVNLGTLIIPKDTQTGSPVSGVIAVANAGASPLPVNLTVENLVDVPP